MNGGTSYIDPRRELSIAVADSVELRGIRGSSIEIVDMGEINGGPEIEAFRPLSIGVVENAGRDAKGSVVNGDPSTDVSGLPMTVSVGSTTPRVRRWRGLPMRGPCDVDVYSHFLSYLEQLVHVGRVPLHR